MEQCEKHNQHLSRLTVRHKDNVWYCIRGERPRSPSTSTHARLGRALEALAMAIGGG